MVLTKSDSVLKSSEFTPVKVKNKGKKDKNSRGSVNDLNSSFSLLDADPPSPCKICSKVVENGKSIRCDNCMSWVHSECSKLSVAEYKFLEKASCPASIKWFCPVCETNPDKNAQRDQKLDTLAFLVLNVTQQNSEILNKESIISFF